MTIKYVSFSKKKFASKELRLLEPYLDEMKEVDQKRFKLFLQSPFFNKDECLYPLYETLTAANKKGSTHLNGKTLLAKWHRQGQKAPNVELIPKKIKQLQQLITDYFAHQHIRDSKKDRIDILHRRFRNQGVPIILDKIIVDKKKSITTAAVGIQKLIDSYLISHHTYYEFDTNHEQNGLELMLDLNQQLEEFYQAMRVVYTTELQNLKRAFSRQGTVPVHSYLAPLSTELQGWFKRNMAIYDADGNFSKKGLDEFTILFLEKNKELDPLLRYMLCKYTVNALSKQVNKGQDELKEELLAWLKRRTACAPKSLAKIDPNEFLNLIIVSCHCGDVDFARKYAKKNAAQLPTNEFTFATQLGEAYCCLFEQKYHQTRAILEKHFQPFSIKHYKYTLRSKTLLIRACLGDELNGHDAYEDFLKIKADFRVYLNRLANKIHSSQFEAYKNFLYVCNKIFLAQKLRPNEHISDQKKRFLSLLEETTQTEAPLICKKWLINIITQQLN